MATRHAQRGSVRRVTDPDLSLAAETLLLAIDPAHGGLLGRRRRVRKALARAYRADPRPERNRPGVRGRAAGRARRELWDAGLIERGRALRGLRLADSRPAARRFQRLRACLRDDDFPEARDCELAVLLAWSAVLPQRLSRDEWRVAVRRLRKLVAVPSARQVALSGRQPMTEGVLALGLVGSLASTDWLSDVSAESGGGQAGFDTGGGGSDGN